MADFPDYEAAKMLLRERLEYFDFEDPPTEEAVIEWLPDLIDVASGDEALYRIDFDAFAAWVQRRHRSPVADDAGIIGVLRAEGILYRVWPKEDNDEHA